MDVEVGRSSGGALVPATKKWRPRPNYRRRVRTRGSPRMRVFLVLITFVVLITASWVIVPALPASFQTPHRRLSSGSIDLCKPTSFEEIGDGALALIVFLLALTSLFVGLAGVTDNYFVPALVVISDRLNLSEDVAGATFMAAGSSAPELFTSLADTLWTKESNIGIGTIVGSAVFNILVIIACAGAFAPSILNIDWRPFTRDICWYCFSIILLFIITYWDDSCGVVSPVEGFGMFACYFGYVLFMAYNESFMQMCTDPADAREAARAAEEGDQDAAGAPAGIERSKSRDRVESMGKILGSPKKKSVGGDDGEDAQDDGDGDDDDDPTFSQMPIQDKLLFIFDLPWQFIFEWTIPDVDSEELRDELKDIMQAYQDEDNADQKAVLETRSTEHTNKCMEKEKGYQLCFTLSIMWIGSIATFMVLLAERCGCIIGIRPAIMGVTVLAAGTSIPDALGSILAAKSEQGDMAVANAIGSNVFDILIGLGLPYGIYGVTDPAAKLYGGYVIKLDGIIAQMVILFLTVLATFVLFLIFKWRLTSGLGYSMLFIYLAFCIYSVITAKNPRWYSDAPQLCIPTPA